MSLRLNFTLKYQSANPNRVDVFIIPSSFL